MPDMIPQGGLEPEFREGHHPIDDVDLGAVLGFAVALAVLTVIVAALLGIAMRVVQLGDDAESARRPALFDDSAGQYAGPRLEVNPALRLPEFRAREQARVDSYEWVERGKVARIPVARAIELIAERGLPRAEATHDEEELDEPTPADAVRRARTTPVAPAPAANATPREQPPSEPRNP
jgi:hypothetical protein